MKQLKRNWFGILYFIFVLLILGLIFYFSSNNAVNSSGQSSGVLAFIIRIFGLDEELLNNGIANTIIRKLAHFTLFALLGTGLRALFGSIVLRHKVIISLLCGFLAACGDEIHQMFVPGRAGMFTDVLIDMCGVVTGVLFVCMLDWLINRIKQKKNLDA